MKSIFLPGALALAAAATLCASHAAAQVAAERSLAGTVVENGQPVSDVPVTLHRVTPDESGPVGRSSTDARGAFSFALPPADTAGFEVFFVTAEHLSVRYFGQPVHGAAAPADYTVAVYDTASSLPGAVRVARRDIVLIPETQGGWEANEIIRLHNGSERTLVSADGMPVWETGLPEGVTDFQAGEGEMTAAEVVRMGDRAMLVASLVPGERELFLRYRIPPKLEVATIPIGSPTDTFHLFVGQPSPAVEVANLETTNVVEVQGQSFVQYGTTDLADGEEVSFRWDPPAGPPLSPVVAGSLAAILILVAGSWFAVRSRGRPGGEAKAAAATGAG